MQLLLSKIAEILACEQPEKDSMVTGTVIDSRKVVMGNLFIALQGEHVDGHHYLATARLAGATAALVTEKQDDELTQLVVKDVVKAFGMIAKYWRQQCNAKLVAVTGSNGKTTVKEMLASVLRLSGNVIATEGNLNNELGVPLTLSRLENETDFAVIEMGANHAGEIARLVAMAMPNVSIINNVAAAHLEGFSSIDGVAKAKAEIFSGLVESGTAVINTDMKYADEWKQVLTNHKIISFAIENEADITAIDIQNGPHSSHFMVEIESEFHAINLPLPGLHNVANALATIAITRALDIPVAVIVKGLAAMKSVPHRLELRRGRQGAQLIDDSYNANPGSYQQALSVLQASNGEHWLVLGDFGELGSESESLHYKMGLDAKESGVNRLWTVGTESRAATQAYGNGAKHFEHIADLQQQLEKTLSSDVTCLIKGSRFMQLDKLADKLANRGED